MDRIAKVHVLQLLVVLLVLASILQAHATNTTTQQDPVHIEVNQQAAYADASLCGPGCITVIGRLLGQQVTLQEIIDRIPALNAQDGCSLLDLEACAQSLDLDMHCITLEKEVLASLTTPFIVHLTEAHFIVIAEIADERCLVYDPAQPTPSRIPLDQVKEMTSGHALVWRNDAEKTAHARFCILGFFSGFGLVGLATFSGHAARQRRQHDG